MGATVTVKYIHGGEMNYEFDAAKDGEAFKKDLERGFKKDGKKTKITIKKTKDIKLEVKRNYYDETEIY